MTDMSFDLGLFWEGLTRGLNWILSLVLFGFVWILGRFRAVAGRRAEAGIDRAWDRISAALRSMRHARQARTNERDTAKRMARVRADRVGRTFRYRTSAGDPGMVGEIVDLHRDHPELMVIMTWKNPPGRAASDDDFSEGQRIGIEWKQLRKSESDQKHRTARMIARSNNDADGWVEFEEI